MMIVKAIRCQRKFNMKLTNICFIIVGGLYGKCSLLNFYGLGQVNKFQFIFLEKSITFSRYYNLLVDMS